MAAASFIRFSSARIAIAALLSIAYLLWSYFITGFRGDHLALVLVALSSYFGTAKTRSFVTGFYIFIFYWWIYDSLRAYPNYMVNPVHIKEPYELDKMLFGVMGPDGLLTLNEYWRLNTSTFLDVVTALFYINWVPVPIAVGIYFFFKKKLYMLELFYLFLWVNIFGWIVYYLYPAAPPWYVAEYGFTENFNIPGSAGGLLAFDQLIGYDLFKDLYVKGSNVFAAIPSMHCAFPILLIWYGIKAKMKIGTVFFVLFAAGIVFSSIYSNHHYLIDGLIGIAVAIVAIVTFELLLLPNGLRKFLQRVADSMEV